MAEIVLLRHGATEWSVSGKHTGRSDVDLTPAGEQQARAAGAALAGRHFALALSSPLRRARRTAELAGLTVEAEPDLAEWDYGAYEGRTTAEICEERPDWSLWRDGTPGGESAPDVGRRADAVLARVRPTYDGGGDSLLVAHGHLLRVLAARWVGLGPEAGALFRLDTASLSALGSEHGRPVLQRWNHVPGEPA